DIHVEFVKGVEEHVVGVVGVVGLTESFASTQLWNRGDAIGWWRALREGFLHTGVDSRLEETVADELSKRIWHRMGLGSMTIVSRSKIRTFDCSCLRWQMAVMLAVRG